MNTRSRASRRRNALALMAALVGLAHLELWGWAQAATPPRPDSPPALQLRLLPGEAASPAPAQRPSSSDDSVAAPVSDPPAPASRRAPTAKPTQPATPQTVPARSRVGSGASPALSPADSSTPSLTSPTSPPGAPPAPPPTSSTTAEPASRTPDWSTLQLAQVAPRPARSDRERAPAAAAEPEPTRIPEPTTLRYGLRRGPLSGDGELVWGHDGRSYHLDLVAHMPILGTIFAQHSQGVLDGAGVAPVRYTEKRIGKSERAVNFVRPEDGSAGHVAFSARTGQQALLAGMQDRVSWMAQLAARLLAWKGEPRPGQRLSMAVAGPGGDVQDWHFLVKDATSVEGERLWHLLREPDQPFDTQAEVWVSPQRGMFPVRVRMSEAQGDPLELVLR